MDLIFHTSKDISSWNRKFSHSPLYAFENTNKALKSDSSSNVISLNGNMNLQFMNRPKKHQNSIKRILMGLLKA